MRGPFRYSPFRTTALVLLGAFCALCGLPNAQGPAGNARHQVPRGVRPADPAAPLLHCVGFEEFATGAIASTVSTPLGALTIRGHNPTLLVPNAAVIFDSAHPTSNDLDLGTPNEDFGGPGQGVGGEAGSAFANTEPQGKILIVAENMEDKDGDGRVDVPDDSDLAGSMIELNFSAIGPVEVESLLVIDGELDRPNSMIVFHGPGGAVVGLAAMPSPGDNGVTNVPINVGNVERMVFRLSGSTAIDDVRFRQFVDCDGNGVQDYEDIDSKAGDCNHNGILDACEPDCDSDGIPDECESDCDRDGIPDDCEPDWDSDGKPDDCEPD